MGPALTVLPLVLAVAALVLTTSCSPPDREPAPEPAAEPSVSVELVQYRRDEALHQLQVKVTNAGTRKVVLDRLRVGLPGFADVPPSDGTAAALAVLDGTTLFGITAGTPLPIDLGGAAVDVPVTVAPQRCDPHAVAESKRGYAFRVGMALDGAEPVLVTVDVEPEQRPVLEAALLERCGLG